MGRGEGSPCRDRTVGAMLLWRSYKWAVCSCAGGGERLYGGGGRVYHSTASSRHQLPDRVHCSSSKSSSSDRCMVIVLLGHSDLEASPTCTGRGLGPRAQPKLHGIPHSDPCHLSWHPRGWWLHVSPGSGIPLYQDWSAPRPCRLLGLACTSTMPFPDIVTILAFTPNPAHSHCGQDW